jgi:hypothetical protein|tara:strand:- start:44 stop:241 length:198 start_codon:yes stop_codon:yes gene_type:complete
MSEQKRIKRKFAEQKLYRDAQRKVMQSNKPRVGGPGIGGRKKIRGSSAAEDKLIRSIYRGKRTGK